MARLQGVFAFLAVACVYAAEPFRLILTPRAPGLDALLTDAPPTLKGAAGSLAGTIIGDAPLELHAGASSLTTQKEDVDNHFLPGGSESVKQPLVELSDRPTFTFRAASRDGQGAHATQSGRSLQSSPPTLLIGANLALSSSNATLWTVPSVGCNFSFRCDEREMW